MSDPGAHSTGDKGLGYGDAGAGMLKLAEIGSLVVGAGVQIIE
jgi:hypothetical protein